MKKWLSFIALLVVNTAVAGEVAGNITLIRNQDISVGNTWIRLGITSVGSCGTYGGYVLFMIKDDERGRRQLAAAMTAKAMGKPVTIGYDDVNFKINGWCYIRYIDI